MLIQTRGGNGLLQVKRFTACVDKIPVLDVQRVAIWVVIVKHLTEFTQSLFVHLRRWFTRIHVFRFQHAGVPHFILSDVHEDVCQLSRYLVVHGVYVRVCCEVVFTCGESPDDRYNRTFRKKDVVEFL